MDLKHFTPKGRGGGIGCAGCAIAHPLFDDLLKLSVEKEIFEIGQDLTELEVNETLEILENLINIMNFAFE